MPATSINFGTIIGKFTGYCVCQMSVATVSTMTKSHSRKRWTRSYLVASSILTSSTDSNKPLSVIHACIGEGRVQLSQVRASVNLIRARNVAYMHMNSCSDPPAVCSWTFKLVTFIPDSKTAQQKKGGDGGGECGLPPPMVRSLTKIFFQSST